MGRKSEITLSDLFHKTMFHTGGLTGDESSSMLKNLTSSNTTFERILNDSSLSDSDKVETLKEQLAVHQQMYEMTLKRLMK